jgi:very-short-patch-repair endonuclease
MIETLLEGIRLGEVRLVRCQDVADMLAHLRIWGDQDRNGLRVVLCNWGEVPKPDEALSQVIDALARTALSLWPNWYGVQRSDSQAHPRSILASTRCAVSAPWLEAAANRCRAGKTPRLAKFANAIQAAQLALAIEPERLHIVLALSAVHSESESLLCFARAAEWLAKETQARVIAVVPSRLAGGVALDSINFRAFDFSLAPEVLAPQTEEKRSLLVLPFHGNPHPDSPGEQLLAQYLHRDAELAGLFCFNQPVRTLRGTSHTVDLIWPGGSLVVEVDGYGWHSSLRAFRQDRQRDYELAISGYLVLRLTHDEVMEDVVLALEKIRDAVAYRRRQNKPRGVCT